MTSQIASAPEHAAIEVIPRARFEILGAILLAMFLGALDQTIVGPVLPEISNRAERLQPVRLGRDLIPGDQHRGHPGLRQAVRLLRPQTDADHRHRAVPGRLDPVALGPVSRPICSWSSSAGVQGLGAGALFPIALAVIGDLFTPAERGKYQGLFGAVFGIAFLVGPFLGGVLTDNLSWHYIFFVNLPVGAVSLYLIWHLLPMVRRRTPSSRSTSPACSRSRPQSCRF